MKNKIKNFLLKKRIKILRNKKGFSLMEVLVAVGIIAIISGIAVTTFQGNREQAAEVAAMTSANNVLRAHNACVALSQFTACDDMNELGIVCEDCNGGKDGAGTKFCVGVSKTVGAQSLKVCIGKNGTTTQKTIGGTLLSNYKICHLTTVEVSSGSCASKHPERPTDNFKRCTDAQMTADNNFCGTQVTGATDCNKTYTCKSSSKTGACSSGGDCG